MMRTAEAAEWMYGAQAPRRHRVAAWVALVLSLLVHAVALLRLPPLSIWKPGPEWAVEHAMSSPPFQIEQIRIVPLEHDPTRDVPDSLRAEERLQEAFRPAAPRVEERVIDPILSALPDSEPDLAGAREALTGPASFPEPMLRQARVQQLEITRQVVPDIQAARPRRVVPRIDRVPDAPDITAPADMPLPDGSAHDSIWAANTGLEGSLASGPAPVSGGVRPRGDGLAGAAAERILRAFEPATPAESADRFLRFSLRTYRPAREPGAVYFRLEIHRAGPEALPVLPRDVLVVQDCSESMTQSLLDRCKLGLRALIQTLSPEDRFEIVTFRETQDRCFGEWAPATATSRARAQWFIEQLESRGRTDIHGSLERLLDVPRVPGRPVVVVFITDGIPTAGVVDESVILEQFSRANAGAISVFPFGVGARVNRFLLDFLGFKNRGDTFFTESPAAVPSGLQHLAQEIRRPVLTDLTYQATGISADEIYPRTLTHLFLDRPLVLFGRTTDDRVPAGVRIAGRSGDRAHDMVYRMDWAGAEAGSSDLRETWARQKAYHLIGEHAASGDPDILHRLRELSRNTGLRIPYAEALTH